MTSSEPRTTIAGLPRRFRVTGDPVALRSAPRPDCTAQESGRSVRVRVKAEWDGKVNLKKAEMKLKMEGKKLVSQTRLVKLWQTFLIN